MPSQTKWTATQLRAARRIPLKPLLDQIGYKMVPMSHDNWKVYGLSQEIVIKQNYWYSPDDRTGGNAIDLLVNVIGMSFSEAMATLQPYIQP